MHVSTVQEDLARLRDGTWWPRKKVPLPAPLRGLKRGTPEFDVAMKQAAKDSADRTLSQYPRNLTADQLSSIWLEAYEFFIKKWK